MSGHTAWRLGGGNIAVAIGWSPWTGNRLWPPAMLWPRCQRYLRVPLFCCRLKAHTHRAMGTVYILALVLVNVAALSLHRESVFGVFHALAVASLVTIAVGLSLLLLGRRSPTVIATHAYCMTWSYAGLVAAGCGQLTVAVGQDLAAWVVPVVIGAVLSTSAVVIFGRVPSTHDRMLAER